MRIIKISNLTLFLLTLSLIQSATPTNAQGQSTQEEKAKADIGKKKIERPTKKIIEKAPPAKKQREKIKLDRGKGIIELSTKKIIKNAPPTSRDIEKLKNTLKKIKPRSLTKKEKEQLKKLEEDQRKQSKRPTKSSPKKPIRSAKAQNPKVKPGDVRWHASYKEALKASQKSGKPVLLFQLLGNLDEEFT